MATLGRITILKVAFSHQCRSDTEFPKNLRGQIYASLKLEVQGRRDLTP